MTRRVLSLSMLMLLTVAGLGAQQPQPKQLPQVSVTAGRSTIVSTDFDVTRIAVTNPEVADATVVRPREILVDGKSAGTISLILWGDNTRVQYDIVVEQPVTALEQQLHRLFPDETVEVTSNADGIVLSGRASSTQVMLRIAEVVRAASPKANVINMLQVPGGSDAQQVMLQVRIAEVNRKALMEFGTSFFTGATGAGNWIGRGTTGQFGAPEFSELSRSVTTGPGGRTTSLDGKIEFSDFLNIFLFNTSWNADPSAQADGIFPEPRRAQPDRLQQQRGELPCRRRVSDPDCERSGTGFD